jgi:dockerin type I repeat protein
VLPDGEGGYLAVTWDPWADTYNTPDGEWDTGLLRLTSALEPMPLDNDAGVPDPCGMLLLGGSGQQEPRQVLDEGGGRFALMAFEASVDWLGARHPLVGRFDRSGAWLLDQGLGFPALPGTLALGVAGAPDGAGGWFVAWVDADPPLYADGHVVVRRVGADGSALWDRPHRLSLEPQTHPDSLTMAADGSGGAWVAWEESRDQTAPFGTRTYVQHVTADGSTTIGPTAVPLLDQRAAFWQARLVPAGADVIVVIGNGISVLAIRVTPQGGFPWSTAGRLVGTSRLEWTIDDVMTVDAGDGSFYVLWTERTQSFGIGERIDVRRMRPDGTSPWPAQVTALERSNGLSFNPSAALVEGRGLAIAAVDEGSADVWMDLYGQVIDRRGRVKAPVSGAPVCTAEFSQRTPRVFAPATFPGPDPAAPPGSVQALFLWSDQRSGTPGFPAIGDSFFTQGVTFTSQPTLLPPTTSPQIVQGESVTVTLQGDDLAPGAAVEVDPGIVVESATVTPIDPESAGDRIVVTLRADPGGVGAHGLAIVNPDGSRAALPEVLAIGLDRRRIDLDSSGRVDGFDVALFAAAFGRARGDSRYSTAADIDGDGVVDGDDLALLAARFGKSAVD